MGMGIAPTWLRQVTPLFHITSLTTDPMPVRFGQMTLRTSELLPCLPC